MKTQDRNHKNSDRALSLFLMNPISSMINLLFFLFLFFHLWAGIKTVVRYFRQTFRHIYLLQILTEGSKHGW